MEKTIQILLDKYKKQIKIGSIVSAYDEEHPEYLKKLFIVVGFQSNLDSKELIVVLMDHDYKKFLAHIDNIILKSLFTIDDMFPSKINNKFISDRI